MGEANIKAPDELSIHFIELHIFTPFSSFWTFVEFHYDKADSFMCYRNSDGTLWVALRLLMEPPYGVKFFNSKINECFHCYVPLTLIKV